MSKPLICSLIISMFLNQEESNLLSTLANRIGQAAPADELVGACTRIQEHVSDKSFPFAYSAVLLANQGRIEDATKFFCLAGNQPFALTLGRYLAKEKVFHPATVAFADSKPYDAFCQTEFYRKHLDALLSIFETFAKTNPPTAKENVTIADIGAGNGFLTTKMVNKLSQVIGLKSCHLIIVDQSEAMHDALEQYCRANCQIPLTFSHVVACIQDLTADDFKDVFGKEPVWFANIALSLHHMPATEKVNVLTKLKQYVPEVLITEGHANHDTTPKDSPEFVYSVYANYGYYIGEVLDAKIPESDKVSCINDFLLAEAINMLSREYAERVDFHATQEQWQDYGRQAGYTVNQLIACVSLPDRPITFTLHLKRAT